MNTYFAEVQMFAGDFAPRGWRLCNGATMSVATDTALFALIGTAFGGDGETTFKLPDFRGRVAVGTGQGPSLTNRNRGDIGGAESQTLSTAQLPVHNHTATVTVGTGASSATATLHAINSPGNIQNPTGNYIGGSRSATVAIFVDGTVGTVAAMNAASITVTSVTAPLPTVALGTNGSGGAVSIMQPYLGVNFIIAVEGVFPSRS